ncbi:WW domain-binding protein 2-like [Pecten maximus]|uniref:WW domain-binding protein 2-like n=1 Tax=Pecten maximus TaxID=6579 RepID=UPI001458A932|nr:WW domain-binding protein 2-like [Pecten maximus]
MSVNTAHAQFGGVLIFSGERILIFCDGVEMGFDCKDLAHFKGTKKGRIYLTTHRVIFTNKKTDDMLQSFNMPFYCMREVELEQPVFGANYIKGKINPENNGWMGDCRFKLWFTNGGAIEFGTAMLKAGQLASRNFRHQPPAYSPPQGPIYQAPPPAYTPPQANYGWVPHTAFPSAPPPEYVYTTGAPPPYPGVDPSSPPYPPSQTNGTAADAKAQEAAGGAYYNPSTPHNVYVPNNGAPYQAPPYSTPQYSAPPPSYSEAAKKNN